MKPFLLAFLLLTSPLTADPIPHSLSFSLTRPCTTSAPCQAIASVVGKNGFHVNTAHPAKLIVQDAGEGLKFDSLVWKKDSITWLERRGSLLLPFSAQLPGKNNITAVLFFSVCNGSTCLVEKSELTLLFEVK